MFVDLLILLEVPVHIGMQEVEHDVEGGERNRVHREPIDHVRLIVDSFDGLVFLPVPFGGGKLEKLL